MARLIDLVDRHAVRKSACGGCTRHGDTVYECFHEEPCEKLVMEFVSAPTIDPVKHGKWIHGCTDGAGTEFCYCSECDEDALKTKEGYTAFSDFCPNCGARMDGIS